MATTINTSGKNIAVQALASACLYAAVLNSSGTEASGGTPAYARKPITFSAASNGVCALNGTLPTFDIPAGFVLGRVAYYSAVTGGIQHAVDDVTPETFGGQGTYTLDSGSITIADPA